MEITGWLNTGGDADEPRRDWVFLGFVAFAAAAFAYTGVQRVRLDRALGRTAVCLAEEETACAEKGVVELSGIAPKDPRVRVARADLEVLTGDPAPATALIKDMDAHGDELLADVRGDLLLLKGDLAWKQGAWARARGLYEAARGLVKKPELVDDRVGRLDGRADGNARAFTRLLDSCKELLGSAGAGQTEVVALHLEVLRPQVALLSDADPLVKQSISAALDAIQRGAGAASAAGTRSRAGYQGPIVTKPTEPTCDRDAPFYRKRPDIAQRLCDERSAEYDRRFKAWLAWRDADERKRNEEDRQVGRIENENLDTARRLLDEAAERYEKHGAP
jgi:hypothetical protein